jgi:hypothetical protein
LRKKIIVFLLITVCVVNISSSNFKSLLEKYLNNQHKVKSLVCSGEIDINIYNENNVLRNNFNSKLLLFMKAPNLFKLVIKEPTETLIVQKGDIVSKKIGNDGAVITEKVKENGDLFARYFTLGMDKIKDSDIKIIKEESVVENGINMIMFRFEVDNEKKTDKIKRDIYFYENGMVAKSVIYDENNIEVVNILLKYKKENGIYIINELKLTNYSNSVKVINKIIYDKIDVNINVSDKEFNIK